MGFNIDALIDRIVDDAVTKVQSDIQTIGKQVYKDYLDEAIMMVYSYYDNYTPREYKRTYNLHDNVIDTSVMETSPNACYITVRYSSDAMHRYERLYSWKEVAAANFIEGIHGKPSINVEADPAGSHMQWFHSTYKNRKLDKYFKSRGYEII